MERTQKQITGRAPVSYSWDNGQYSRARYDRRSRDAYRVENVSSSGKYAKAKGRNERANLFVLGIATVAILVLMLSMVIGKLDGIVDIVKKQEMCAQSIEDLISEVSVAQTRLSNLTNDVSIKFLAKTELNMIEPDDTDAHVLSNVIRTTPDTTHTAEVGKRP